MPLPALGRAMVLPQHKVAEKEVAQRQEAKSQAANFRSGAALNKPWHRKYGDGRGQNVRGAKLNWGSRGSSCYLLCSAWG